MKQPSFVCVLWIASVLVCGLRAQQQRWVVDTLGAGDATTLQAGVDLASPGDIVFVNTPQGLPLGDVVIREGIHLESRLGWLYFGRITVENLPADQTCSIGGFQSVEFVFRDCQGDVHLGFLGGFFNSLSVDNCDLVVINSIAVNATEIRNSRVLMHHVFLANRFGGPGLTMLNSEVIAVEPGVITGGLVNLPLGAPHYPIPAIAIKNSTLRIIGRDTSIFGGVTCDGVSCVDSPSIVGTGANDIYLTTGVDVTRAVVGANVHVVPDQTVLFVGATAATDPGTNARTRLRLSGDPGDTIFIFASFFVPNPIATPFGEFWLSLVPGAIAAYGSGVIDPSGSFCPLAPINDFLTPGQIVSWQCVVLKPTGELQLTTPAVTAALDFRTHP